MKIPLELAAGVVCPSTAAPAPGITPARVVRGMFPRLMANSDPRAKLQRSLNFHPLGKAGVEAQTMLQRSQQPFPREAHSKHLVVRAVPVRRFANQHPRNRLGTAIFRQIWQFRPRKHKRFLPTGMHPTPMKEITTLAATLEEGLCFSPSTAVCSLAYYLQLTYHYYYCYYYYYYYC